MAKRVLMNVLLVGAALLACCCAVAALAAEEARPDYAAGEFQFRAAFNNGSVDGEAARDFTAYLWVPPSSRKVRGVVLTQQNVGEQVFVEHPAVRAACAKNDLAIVWCYPALDLRFERDRERAVRLQEEVLAKLGKVSGYDELATAPWVTFGHSTTTTFARNLAEARPERTIAILSAKGGIMLPQRERDRTPGVYSAGQFPEWRQPTHDWTTHGASLPGLAKIRRALAERPRPVSYVEEYGGGHFDYSERYLNFLALYIDKAIRYRLNADGSVRPVGADEGYVVDMRPPLPTPPLAVVPFAEARGEARSAPWFFDRELAEAASRLVGAGDWKRRNQIVAFANPDGTPAPFAKSGIVDPVPCEYAEDGVTITRLETTFLERLPDNFAQAGMAFGHAADGERKVERISGVFAAEGGKYRVRLNRGYPHVPNFIAVRHPGDAEYRPSVQPGRFVPPTYSGRAQQIDFARIPDQKVGTREVSLRATSSAGLRVEFFVRSGPAKVAGDRLVLLSLPPRTRFPVEVTVVAWQLGRGGSADPVAAASPVERSFYLAP